MAGTSNVAWTASRARAWSSVNLSSASVGQACSGEAQRERAPGQVPQIPEQMGRWRPFLHS